MLSVVSLLGGTGCAALSKAVPVLTQIDSILHDAQQTLVVIDIAVNEWARKTTPPEAVLEKYAAISSKAHKALSIASKSLQGVEDLDQDQYDSAFEEFKAAYVELVAFLEETGAMSGGKMSVNGQTEKVPEPMAVGYQVQ